MTLKTVHFPLKHSRAVCTSYSRPFVYSEHSVFSESSSEFPYSVPLLGYIIFLLINRLYFSDSQNNDCPGCINSTSLPYYRPSPWPFLLFECRALLSLKYICRAGPAFLPPRVPHCISRNPWDSYQPLHPFYLPPSAPWGK